MINNTDLGIMSKNGVGLFILIARRISHFGSKVKKKKEQHKSIYSESLDAGDEIQYRGQNLKFAQRTDFSPVSPLQVETVECGVYIQRMEICKALSAKWGNKAIYRMGIYLLKTFSFSNI